MSRLEDKVEKTPSQSNNNKSQNNKESLTELQDNREHNNIHITGTPEEVEKEQGLENLFEEIIAENFHNLVKEKFTQVQEAQRVPIKMNQRELHQDTS